MFRPKGGKRGATPARRFLLSVLSLVLLLGACGAPAATPATAPTSPPRHTPPPPITVDLRDKLDDQGALTEMVMIISSDGRARIFLPEGSVPINAQGQRVKTITITPLVPPESKEGVVVGWAYAFTDPWTTVSLKPPATIYLTYVPPPPNPRLDLTKPQMAAWSESKKQWGSRPPEATPGEAVGTIKTTQGYLETMAVIFWYVDVAVPVP